MSGLHPEWRFTHDNWQVVIAELTEIHHKVDTVHSMVGGIDESLDALHQQVKTMQWWALTLALILSADLVMSALVMLYLAK